MTNRSGSDHQMRLLITASRTWTDRAFIRSQLEIARTRRYQGDDYAQQIIVVHGDCPTGGDRIADEEALDLGMHVERHPADWNRHGRRAGFVRNAEMVAAGADFCLAFIVDNSRGASMCADLAEKAGIPTHRFDGR